MTLPSIDVAALRKEYTLQGLRRRDMDPDPMRQFARWLEEALRVQPDDPNAMTLATSGSDGRPSARIVLLKAFNENGFFFFTNYSSRKGRALDFNPHAALNFFWPMLERQICITGEVKKISREDSEAYFHSRPVGSQLGAWASTQSEPVPGRDFLESRLEAVAAQYAGAEVPLPPTWGGYCLTPNSVEFWQGRRNRLHDRLVYTRASGLGWEMNRLAP